MIEPQSLKKFEADNGLKKHFEPHFKIFEGLYSWVASGAVRDFFAKDDHRDIDFFFKNQNDRKEAVQKILGFGGEVTKQLNKGDRIKYGDQYYDLVCWDGTGDPSCYSDSPQKTIEWFDYTVEMAALDSDGAFYSYPTFYRDVAGKRLVRNPIRRIEDLWLRGNNIRLMNYVKKGYAIDMPNLLMFLEDQEATWTYRADKNARKASYASSQGIK